MSHSAYPYDAESPSSQQSSDGADGEINVLELTKEMAQFFYDRYMLNGNPDDLESALGESREGVDMLREGDPDDLVHMQDLLSRCLVERHLETGSEEELEEAIAIAEQLYEARTKDDRRLSILAHNYARAVGYLPRNHEHLNTMVRLLEEAVDAAPQARSILQAPLETRLQDEPGEHVNILNTLASALDDRFQVAGSLDDLNRSIEIMEKLLAAVPQDKCEGDRAHWLSNLSASLLRRFEQDPEGEDAHIDLIRAADLAASALDRTSRHDPRRFMVLSGAAQPFARLAAEFEDESILNKAITCLRGAQEAAPPGNPIHIELGANLAMRLFQMSEMTSSASTADEAVTVAESTLTITPEGHPSRPHLHNLVGLFYYSRFMRRDLQAEAERNAAKARPHLEAALSSAVYTPVYRRVQAGRLLLRVCCEIDDWTGARAAALAAVELIPNITPRSIANADRQRLLGGGDVVGFGSDGAAAVLNTVAASSSSSSSSSSTSSSAAVYEAIHLLETGRGTLAASVASLRADLSALQVSKPDLAARFVALRDELQQQLPGPPQRHHETGLAFDALLGEVRALPGGFGRGFMRAPSEADARAAARDGPLVVLTASRYRGVDAILVESDGVRLVPLAADVTLEALESRAGGDAASPELLEWLWVGIASPVLDLLGFKGPPPDGAPFPRLWWIPTGILSGFPLHAAGRHAIGSTDTVIDRVMSSYSPSIRALLAARSRPYTAAAAAPPSSTKHSKALLVAMPSTPGFSPLSHAREEVTVVDNLLAGSGFERVALVESGGGDDDDNDDGDAHQPRKALVVQHLQGCHIFHFAGHGKEDPSDPSCSALLLHDWETNPLTVGSLLDLNLGSKDGGSPPFLAYLSACETGQVSDEKFRDESIHLISAYQLAGFRHVIGTLWSVDDLACVEMAREVYRVLLEDGFSDESVCRGLHVAYRKLRDIALQAQAKRTAGRVAKGDGEAVRHGKREVEADDSTDDGLEDEEESVWIPYVHFGV